MNIDNSISMQNSKSIALATHLDDILVFYKNLERLSNLYKDFIRSF